MVGREPCGTFKLTTLCMQLSQLSQTAESTWLACSVLMQNSPLQQGMGGGEGGTPSSNNSPSGSSSASAAIKSGDGCGHKRSS